LLKDESILNQKDGEAFIPEGYYWLSDGEYYTGSEGHWIANLANLINTKLHSDFRRSQGCCGLDGCHGLNRICQNGHEVGTERSDCWMAHSIVLDFRRVVLSNGP
jgi:hypothetical protein